MSSERVCAHLLISGRVQGVCYRMYMEEEAKRRGVTGWVRNLPTGQVEAVCEGKKREVDDLIAWCRQGPPAARVKDITIDWQPAHDDLADFRIV